MSVSLSSRESTAVSIVLSRKPNLRGGASSGGAVRVAVAARCPRKRVDHSDPVKFSLIHYQFLDDSRRFTCLDSLLTRLSPISIVHVGCSESAELNSKSSSNRNLIRRAKDVSDLLDRVCSVIDSRADVLHSSAGDNGDGLCHVVPTLPKPLPNPAALSGEIDAVLLRLLGGESSQRHLAYRGDRRFMDDVHAKQAFGLLMKKEHLDTVAIADDSADVMTEEGGHVNAYEWVAGTLDARLNLDRTAAECIGLLPPRHQGIMECLVGGNEQNNSLFGVLNKCKTRMGSRTLEIWLRQPLVSLSEIQRRQDAVASLVGDGVGRDRLRDEGLAALAGVDLDALCARLISTNETTAPVVEDGGSGGTNLGGSTAAALESLYRLYVLADRQLPALVEALGDIGGVVSDVEPESGASSDTDRGALRSCFDGLRKVHNDLGLSIQLAEAVLDLDAAPREFLVKSSYSEELGDIRNELAQIDVELEQLHRGINDLWSEAGGGMGQVRLENTDANAGTSCSWQFRLPNTNDSKLLAERLGHSVTVHRLLKNGVYFSTKELRQLGTKKQDLLVEYDKHQRDIVSNAMSVAITYVPVLERASVLVAELDVLASLAYVAAYNPNGYCRPIMTDSEEDGYGIELQEARHPCVELQESVDYIPNAIRLTFGSSSFLLLTGPNMGGKSTYIRSLGAIVTMAQIGSYVPCTSAKINIVHHILTRVGAGDLQDRGISTFMAEMLEASSILRTATKRSLIIIDELGRGTSTFDGFGLATAISEYIIDEIGCMTVFATHFHELTSLEERKPSVKNCHVTAQRPSDGSNGLTFLYEVHPGPCLESFGIQVAEMANVPMVVVADAKRKAKQLENFDGAKKKQRANEMNKQKGTVGLLEQFKDIPFKSLSRDEQKKVLQSLA